MAGGDWQNMDKRVRFLDTEGIDYQVLFPTLGLLWEGEVKDPQLAAALCRAYNTWAFEVCAGHLDRLFPAAHISLRDPALAAQEIKRVAKLGAHSIMVGSAPVHGKSFGHADYDEIWATAQDHNIAVSIHPAGNKDYIGSAWYRNANPGFMFISMNVIQDPRMALSTMVYDGVFERFPHTGRTVESMGSWVGEWIERFEYRYQYMRHTSQMKGRFANTLLVTFGSMPTRVRSFYRRSYSLSVMRNFSWAQTTRMQKDFPIRYRRCENCLSFATASVDKILGDNARAFYGI